MLDLRHVREGNTEQEKPVSIAPYNANIESMHRESDILKCERLSSTFSDMMDSFSVLQLSNPLLIHYCTILIARPLLSSQLSMSVVH